LKITLALPGIIVGAVGLTFGALHTPSGSEARQEINPADFSSTITNPYFPLSQLEPKLFEGTDTDQDTG
jgi:hypothetical protein